MDDRFARNKRTVTEFWEGNPPGAPHWAAAPGMMESVAGKSRRALFQIVRDAFLEV